MGLFEEHEGRFPYRVEGEKKPVQRPADRARIDEFADELSALTGLSIR